ncbi:hypothetical protein ACEE90_03405 [Corynebacterium phoceense]
MTAMLVADGGELTVLRSLAAFSYGTWDVTWPDSVPEEERPDPGEDRQFGYVADLGREPGPMGRRFVRSDVSITAVEYADGKPVEYSGTSNVEEVLDAAESRTNGGVYAEREITRAGLGALIPYVDFDIGDIVPVLFWNLVLELPVAEIRNRSAVGELVDYPVMVGSSMMPDTAAAEASNRELMRTIAQERRERGAAVNSVASTANAANNTANAANNTANAANNTANAANNTANAALSMAKSADGKSTNFYGAEDPVAGGAKPNPGDTWFRDNTDGSITILVFDGAKGWVEAVPEVDFSEVNARLDQARADVDKAKRDVAAAMEDVAAVESLVAKKVDTSAYDSAMAENRRRLQSLDVDLANKISRGDVQAPDIVANAVTAGKIAANTITAAEIAAGTITGTEIAAGAISASKMTLIAENLCPDPFFDQPSNAVWSINSNAKIVSGNGYQGHPNSQELTTFPTGSSNMNTYAAFAKTEFRAPVVPGEKFIAYFMVKTTGRWTTPGNGFSAQVYFYDANGDFVSGSVGNQTSGPRVTVANAPVGEWFKVGGEGVVTAPERAATASLRPTVYVSAGATATNAKAYVGYVHLQRAADGNLIVDGAVTADKIQAGAVVAGKIAAGAVTAGTIAADAVTAREIKSGSLTSDNVTIKAGAITDAMIQNGSITAASIKDATITSAKIAQLDAGKITTGYLNAARIAAGSISTEKLAANSITTEKLAIVPGNLFPDPHFRDPSWEKAGQTTRSGNNNGELNIFATGNQNGTYYKPAGVSANKALLFEPGAAYRVSSTVWTSTGVTTASVYIRYASTSGSTRTVRLGTWDNLPNGVSQQSFNCVTPSDMGDGSATVGFYLEATQKSGQLSLWNTQITRAADSNLIVNGAIKAEHIAADTITARQVNADEIFLTKDGKQSLDDQYDSLADKIDWVGESLMAYRAVMGAAVSKLSEPKAGFIYYRGGQPKSPVPSGLFSVDTQGNLTAKGDWKGRLIEVVPTGNTGLDYFEITATNRTFKPGSICVVFWMRDEGVARTARYSSSSVATPAESTWTTVQSFSLPVGDYSISSTVTWGAASYDQYYGIRVVKDGDVIKTNQRRHVGPLLPTGNGVRTLWVGADGAGTFRTANFQVQVYCNSTIATRRSINAINTVVDYTAQS